MKIGQIYGNCNERQASEEMSYGKTYTFIKQTHPHCRYRIHQRLSEVRYGHSLDPSSDDGTCADVDVSGALLATLHEKLTVAIGGELDTHLHLAALISSPRHYLIRERDL